MYEETIIQKKVYVTLTPCEVCSKKNKKEKEEDIKTKTNAFGPVDEHFAIKTEETFELEDFGATGLHDKYMVSLKTFFNEFDTAYGVNIKI